MHSNEHKRRMLFLFGCIGSRLLLTLLAKTIPLEYLPIMGYLAIIPALGFLFIYLTGSRKTGPEVFGEKIWWNNLRPIHSAMYALFAYAAITKNRNAWMVLLADVTLGLVSFLSVHKII